MSSNHACVTSVSNQVLITSVTRGSLQKKSSRLDSQVQSIHYNDFFNQDINNVLIRNVNKSSENKNVYAWKTNSLRSSETNDLYTTNPSYNSNWNMNSMNS